jgi:hypothetical protein
MQTDFADSFVSHCFYTTESVALVPTEPGLKAEIYISCEKMQLFSIKVNILYFIIPEFFSKQLSLSQKKFRKCQKICPSPHLPLTTIRIAGSMTLHFHTKFIRNGSVG